MNTVVLPAGWEQHAAPAATLLDPLGASPVWWGAAALLLVAALGLSEARPSLSMVLAILSTPVLAIAANGLVDDAYIQFRYAANAAAGALPSASGLRTFDLYGLCSPVTHMGGSEAGHRLWGLREAVASGADLIYPGRELLLVESRDAVLPAAERHSSDAADVLESYRTVTISHVPEYRLDFLRDAIWVRRELFSVVPRPGSGPTGR